MAETSWILALKPKAVAPDYKSAQPKPGQSITELERIAAQKDWPGYFGAPALASAELGKKMYEQWLQRATELINRMLDGKDITKLPRFGDVYGNDPADAAAATANGKLEAQHDAWLKRLSSRTH